MSGSALIVAAQGPDATAGGGIVADVASLTQDNDAWDYGVDGVTLGLDALGMVLDPFGAIASAGVGWVLQHVWFLREPIDKLTGDPAQIQALAGTWENIAKQLADAAVQYQRSVGTTASWTGQAADDYRKAAQDYLDVLAATADHANHASEGITAAGIIVGTERGLIYDTISSFIGRLVIEAIAALAASWCTFGGSVAAFLVAADLDASIQAENTALRVGKLMQRIGRFAEKFDGMGQRAKTLAKDLERAGGKLRQVAGRNKGLKTITHNRYLRRPADGPASTFVHKLHSLEGSPLANVHDVTDDWRFKTGHGLVNEIDAAHKQAEQSGG